jgi:hypothetical protein
MTGGRALKPSVLKRYFKTLGITLFSFFLFLTELVATGVRYIELELLLVFEY